jgi:hypothetical protein
MTVMLTGLLVPCQEWHCGEDPEVVGECDFHFDVWLLWAMVADLDFKELAMALRTQHGLWHPRRISVEEKQSGVSLLQTFKGSHIPVRGQKVEQGKIERAVNPVLKDEVGLPVPGGGASVQGWGRMGRIRYPVDAPWIEAGPDGEAASGFLRRVLAFKGGNRGSDEFDALVHLVTRAITLSRRHGRFSEAPKDDGPAYPADFGDGRRQMIEGLAGLQAFASLAPNPFETLCGAPCQHYGVLDNKEWCGLHGRRTSAIDGCTSWAQGNRAA